MERDFAEFVVTGVAAHEMHSDLMKAIKSLMKDLRPNIVSLADSWGFSDALLNSSVGKKDGNVYEVKFLMSCLSFAELISIVER